MKKSGYGKLFTVLMTILLIFTDLSGGLVSICKLLTPMESVYAADASANYYIRYKTRYGNGTMASQNCVVGQPVKIRNCGFTRSGYDFEYWREASANGTEIKHYPYDRVTRTTMPEGGVVEYEAVWKLKQSNPGPNLNNTKRILFYKNVEGDYTRPNVQNVSYPNTVNLDTNSFVRKGYIFDSWNTKPDGSGTTFDDRQVLYPNDYKNGLTLYAQWLTVERSISFNSVSLNLFPDGKAVLVSAEFAPEQEVPVIPEWSSSDEAVVTVSGCEITKNSYVFNALVTPLSEGTATITVSALGCSDTLSVSVNDPSNDAPDPDYNPKAQDEYNEEDDDVSDDLTRRDLALFAGGKIPDGIWIAGLAPTYKYNGSKICPVVRVYNRDERLTEKVDYLIKYRNNVQAGDKSYQNGPKIIITMRGNFSGTKTVGFTISPVDLSECEVYDRVRKYSSGDLKLCNPVVTYKKKVLVYGVDYITDQEHRYMSATPKEGTEVRLDGLGNFTGSVKARVTIYPDIIPISKAKIKVKAKNLVYDEDMVKRLGGMQLDPAKGEISVKYFRKNLVQGKDYTLTYINNASAGKATVIVTGKGDFAGTVRRDFRIKSAYRFRMANIKARSFYLDGTPYTDYYRVHYTGRRVRPVVSRILVDGEELKEGVDYTVSYSNNLKRGTGHVIVKGIGRCSGKKVLNFKILPVNLEFEDVSLSFASGTDKYVFVKGGVKPAMKVTMNENGKILVEGRDYKLLYSRSTKLGKAKVTVKGMGNYMGKLHAYYEVLPQTDPSAAVLSAIPDTCSDAPGKWKAQLKIVDRFSGKTMIAGKDYLLSTRKDRDIWGNVISENAALRVGTEVFVTVEGSGAYEGLLISGSYKIAEQSIMSATVTFDSNGYAEDGDPTFTYTGSNIVPDPNAGQIIVKYGDKVLDYGTDYYVVYNQAVNRINKGSYDISIVGLGSYSGIKTVKYTISTRSTKDYWYGNAEK